MLAPGLSALALAAAFPLAWASWRFVERPFRQRLPRGFGRPAIFGISGLAVMVMAVAGAGLYLDRGAPQRLVPDALRTFAGGLDMHPMTRTCLGRIAQDDLCRLGASGEERDFLLWGDSHAAVLMPAVDTSAEQAGKRGVFAGAAACLPIPMLTRDPEDRRSTNLNRAVLGMLEGRDDMPVVIPGARWVSPVEGVRFGDETGGPVHLRLAPETADGGAGADNAALVNISLSRTVDAILDTGRSVILLGPVPEVG